MPLDAFDIFDIAETLFSDRLRTTILFCGIITSVIGIIMCIVNPASTNGIITLAYGLLITILTTIYIIKNPD